MNYLKPILSSNLKPILYLLVVILARVFFWTLFFRLGFSAIIPLFIDVFLIFYLYFLYLEKPISTHFSGKNVLDSFLEFINGFIFGVVFALIILSFFWALDSYILYGLNFSAFSITSILYVLLLSLHEEIMFRGILQTYLQKYVGVIFAIVISSIMFGLFHLANRPLIGALAVGCTLGVLCGVLYTVKTSITLIWGFHASINVVIQSIGWFQFEDLEKLPIPSTVAGPMYITGGIYGPWASPATLTLVALIVYFLFKCNKHAFIERTSNKNKEST